MLMPLTAEDIVIGIFYQLSKGSKIEISADREELHRAFYNMKEHFPEIMSVFSFREREQFPESSQLDQALSNLDACGLISRQNLSPRYYRIEDPLKGSYVKYSKGILSESQIDDEQISRLATELGPLVHGNV